ncbi:MAG: hypothetical protein AVDCRST_MAG93-623, partial [uncultured Chloroflexia bacterium]
MAEILTRTQPVLLATLSLASFNASHEEPDLRKGPILVATFRGPNCSTVAVEVAYERT